MRILPVLLLFAGSALAAGPRAPRPAPAIGPPPRPPRPPPWEGEVPLGRFDERGGYHRPERYQRFLELHGIRDVPEHPVLLVHGLFGVREMRLGPFYARYFVGVEKFLRSQGVKCLFPQTTPFASWEQRARQLQEEVEAAGWDRFHIIAHSAGGIDARYLITHLGMGDRVISLTTVGTPHHGVWYADFVTRWVMEKQGFWRIWDLMGLPREGVENISVRRMVEFNRRTPDAPGVRYFSFGGSQSFLTTPPVLSTGTLINAISEKAALGRRPGFRERMLAATVLPRKVRRRLRTEPRALVQETVGGARDDLDWIVPELAGKNDGLVSLSSARWGTYLGDLNADHLDQMGWFSSFPARRFYRNICRFLFDQGL